jgi:hypothetical protein
VTGWDDLRAAVAAVAGEDPSHLPAVALGARVVELRALIDGLEGLWSRLVRVLDGSGAVEEASGTAAWLRAACRLSPADARSRVVLARRLAQRAETEAALASGTISVGHARLVTAALAELEAAAGPELATATEAPLLDAARRCDPARLRREIAHARHALVPAAAADADDRLHFRRHLDVATTFEGTVVVSGVLDPEGGEALLAALAPLSGPAGPADDRTPGRRRADALVELCHQRLDAGTLPALGGERPHLTVLVPLAALPGLAAADVRASPGPPPVVGGHVAGGPVADGPVADGPVVGGSGMVHAGMVGAETVWGAVLGRDAARRLACDASVTRVVLDPVSQPLDVGRRTRVVPPAVRTALFVRDRGCVFPGCDRPPPWTDAHHVIHWADGGPTSLDNLVLLCRRHHRAVHEGRRTLVRGPTGHWTAAAHERDGPAAPRVA